MPGCVAWCRADFDREPLVFLRTAHFPPCEPFMCFARHAPPPVGERADPLPSVGTPPRSGGWSIQYITSLFFLWSHFLRFQTFGVRPRTTPLRVFVTEFLLALPLRTKVPPNTAALIRSSWTLLAEMPESRNPSQYDVGCLECLFEFSDRQTRRSAFRVRHCVTGLSTLHNSSLFLEFGEISCCSCIRHMQEFLDFIIRDM